MKTRAIKIKLISDFDVIEFKSITEAAKFLDVSISTVSNFLKRKKGLINGWEIEKL
ncbi:MAG: hypothetical protein ACTSP4_00790 [Candidatus Hodarchaeales archaeon]